jgi:hypothetical protein
MIEKTKLKGVNAYHFRYIFSHIADMYSIIYFADYVIGRDAVEEPLQAVDAEAVSEGNPKSGEFPFFPFCIFLISSTGLLWNFPPKHHFLLEILKS